MINLNEFEIQGDVSNLPTGDKLEATLLNALITLLGKYSMARNTLEDKWAKAYYAYATTREAKQNLTNVAKQVIGRTKVNWRHKLKSPKAFELVETIESYMMGAFFPNQKWFDFAAAGHTDDPNFRTILELNRKFINKQLENGEFRDMMRMHIRETCITGTSGFMYPWHEAMQNAKFNVMSCFEFWLDPTAQRPNDANLFRKYTLHKAEVIANKDFFNLMDKKTNQFGATNTIAYDRNMMFHLRRMLGIDVETLSSHNDDVDIFEFWGDLLVPELNIIIKNIRASFTLEGLYNFMPNPFIYRPIIITNYVQLSSSPYGISALQSVLSQLYYKDVMMSRHADAVVASIDPTYTYLHDGVVDPNEVYMAPGHTIPVTQTDAIRPVQTGGDMNVSVQDMTIVEQTIDKAVGTGPFIGVGQGRAAERVTKAEIDAQIAAGGNRLNDVYDHMQTNLLRFLKRYRDFFRVYYAGQTQIEVRQLNPQLEMFNQDIWANVDISSFQFDVEIKPLGAANVATREFKLRQTFEWMTIVGQNPNMNPLVDWNQVLQHITFTMLPDEAAFFLLPPQTEQTAPTDPAGQLREVLQNAGAGADVKALEAASMAGQLPAVTQQLAPKV